MQDFDCTLQKKVADKPELSNFPAHRMSFTTRDMARIGQLMLQNGQWDGKQVIPADWIKTITSLVTLIMEINPPFERRPRRASPAIPGGALLAAVGLLRSASVSRVTGAAAALSRAAFRTHIFTGPLLHVSAPIAPARIDA